jgi:uncharacterized membrane protein (DUF485 family)
MIDEARRKRRNIRLAVFLALVAFAFYVGFIVINASNRAG